MPSRQSRLRTLSPAALQRLARSLASNNSVSAYDDAAMYRRRAAIWCYIDPGLDPAETRLMRRHIGWPVEASSARRIWALRRQLQALRALRASSQPTLP